MPRHARVNFPGAVYHIMTRGIEKREIFFRDADRADLFERLAALLPAHGCRCLSWAFMPNHIHLLIHAGDEGISELMRALLTGYAVSFNLRHSRVGHLFANRYKSIICAEERYILALARYINLNPLRGGIVSSLAELCAYPWCSYGELCGFMPPGFLDARGILEHFGEDLVSARRRYAEFVSEGVGQPCPPQEISQVNRAPVADAIGEGVGHVGPSAVHPGLAWVGIDEVFRISAAEAGVSPEELRGERSCHAVSKGKALAVFLGVAALGMRKKQMAEMTRMRESSATMAFRRGRQLANDAGIMEKLKN